MRENQTRTRKRGPSQQKTNRAGTNVTYLVTAPEKILSIILVDMAAKGEPGVSHPTAGATLLEPGRHRPRPGHRVVRSSLAGLSPSQGHRREKLPRAPGRGDGKEQNTSIRSPLIVMKDKCFSTKT